MTEKNNFLKMVKMNGKEGKKPVLSTRSKKKSSKYRGVSKCSKDGRWQARIRVGKVVKYLGRFCTQEEAAHAYDVGALKYHSAKAITNFPPSSYGYIEPVPVEVVEQEHGNRKVKKEPVSLNTNLLSLQSQIPLPGPSVNFNTLLASQILRIQSNQLAMLGLAQQPYGNLMSLNAYGSVGLPMLPTIPTLQTSTPSFFKQSFGVDTDAVNGLLSLAARKH